ncbi:hypothetical protein L6164_006161 [Bauhinia variegata]|uniref:Uncharacterized protein n=1 Tax=Bauhinia variegata TaxID=167791 RepID=A0ACB9PT25_BAUVA|nr:hypothetical protein L6164_006161 [Bauhinia variegata]
MFPSYKGNQMVIKFSSSPTNQQHDDISQDLVPDDYASLDASVSDERFARSGPKKLSHGSAKNHGRHSGEYKKKKLMNHRDTERKRRQEMATLYASLRSLLPFEFIKGKRSISEHMNEAVNYIKHLQKNIEELTGKRDELRKFYNSNPENHESKRNSSSFTIHENNGRVEIEIASGLGEEPFRISELLELLLEEGLEVISCLSSKVNGRLLHSLRCEVKNSNSANEPELRRKIRNVISSFQWSD